MDNDAVVAEQKSLYQLALDLFKMGAYAEAARLVERIIGLGGALALSAVDLAAKIQRAKTALAQHEDAVGGMHYVDRADASVDFEDVEGLVNDVAVDEGDDDDAG